MKQLFKKNDLVGKTIKRFLFSGNRLWLRFTDDSFVVIETRQESEGFGQHYDVMDVDDMAKDNTDSELVTLELITKKEHEKAIQEEEEKYEIRRQKRIREEQEENKKRELELLEQLRNKYDNKNNEK